MKDPKFIDELVEKLSNILPEGMQALGEDLRSNFKQVLMSHFEKMDLVTREEFDVQKGVLAKTRAKLDALERELRALEEN